MISNFSDIFRQQMKSSINEGKETILRNTESDFHSLINRTDQMSKFFDRNNVLDLIRRNKFDRAVKLIKSNRINPFSLFDKVNIFGNTYDKIPFVFAAIALALEKAKNQETMNDRFNRILTELFVPAGINSSNMFDAKFTSPSGCNDVLSFVLTHDGQINPKKYDESSDLEIMVLLSSLLDSGYSLSNHDGMLKYIFENDMISCLKKMIESKLYEMNIDDIKKYSMSPVSNIAKYISFAAPHPFRFHSPEIEVDDKGKFCGGSIYSPLKSVGYDISKPDKEFKIHLSVPFMIKGYIDSAHKQYCENGENFSNEYDISFGEGSEFFDAFNMLKYLSNEYMKYTRAKEHQNIKEDDRKKYMIELVKSANSNIQRLQNGLNTILSTIGFPKTILLMNNELKDNDSKILYKTAPFMKEIWNSIKLNK